MKLARAELVSALRLRYDHHSAETVLAAACNHAGVPDQPEFDRAQVAQLRASLPKVGDRLQRVDERLEALLGEAAQAPQATAAPAPIEPLAPEPAKAAQAPQATAAPEPVEKKKKGKKDETRVVLTGLEVGEGERVLMCGDRADLGSWDPDKAHAMTKDGDVWTATIELGDGGEFKFLRRTADGTFKWEGGENRELEAVAKIEARWQR
jgi:hypothetical protein